MVVMCLTLLLFVFDTDVFLCLFMDEKYNSGVNPDTTVGGPHVTCS